MSSIREVFKNVFTESKQPQQEVKNEMPTPEVKESYSGQIVDASTPQVRESYSGQIVDAITPQVRESYSGEIVDAETCTAKSRTTKTNQVLNHLKEYGCIDSWTAIQRYGATRLSAIIFVLRARGFDIVSIPNSVLDRNYNVCNYTNYKLQK